MVTMKLVMAISVIIIALLCTVCIPVTIGQMHGSLSTARSAEVLEVMEDSFISLIDGKALLHLRNVGAEGVVITGFEIKGFSPLEKVDLGDSIGLFGNGIWIDKSTGEVGLNVGGEGFVIIDLSNATRKMADGGIYTLLIYTKNHGMFKAYLKAMTESIPTKAIQTTAITITSYHET
ncbi:MAG: hypothetical protein J7L51_01335 [Desulfurococcales archaeon]|nr:hypothetical protein [Desulfurococcales archaeon]